MPGASGVYIGGEFVAASGQRPVFDNIADCSGHDVVAKAFPEGCVSRLTYGHHVHLPGRAKRNQSEVVSCAIGRLRFSSRNWGLHLRQIFPGHCRAVGALQNGPKTRGPAFGFTGRFRCCGAWLVRYPGPESSPDRTRRDSRTIHCPHSRLPSWKAAIFLQLAHPHPWGSGPGNTPVT